MVAVTCTNVQKPGPGGPPDGAARRDAVARAQQMDRLYAELLQEIRVAQTGVQLLLAGLLTLAFTPRFETLSAGQRHLYVASLVLAAGAAAMLIAPAPFHRILFRRGLMAVVVSAATRFVLGGLLLLLLSLGATLTLILHVVIGPGQAGWLATGTMAWFGLWWYGAPCWSRYRHRAVPGRPLRDR